MTVTTFHGTQIHVDGDGFMTVYDEWDPALGAALAASVGITLTGPHWTVLRHLRVTYLTEGEVPSLRRVAELSGIPVTTLYALFPDGPAAKMAFIAGLPKPDGRERRPVMATREPATDHRPEKVNS